MKHTISAKIEFIEEKPVPLLNDEAKRELLKDKMKDLFESDVEISFSETIKED